MRRLCVLAVALAGCPAGGGPAGSQPSWRGGGQPAAAAPAVLELRPEHPAADAYNDPPLAPAPSSPLGDAVVAAVARAAAADGLAAPRPDGRLFRAADQLARVAPDDAPLTYALIEFALQHEGIIEPSPHLVVIRAPVDVPEAITEKLSERLPAILASNEFARIGVGVAEREGDDVIVVALQASFLTTRPVPRVLAGGGRLRLEGEVRPPFVDPEVFITRTAGAVEKVPIERIGQRGFRAQVSCGTHLGRQQIEINADDDTGATVLANFPVWCGATPPTSLSVERSDDDLRPVRSGEEAEARMLALVNRDRARHDLPPLAIDPRLTEVARRHSEDMRRTGVVAHVSPTTGSAVDRVKAGGVRSAVVLENVARAYGVAEAEEGLMNSPGHRANLLSRDASHIGIGIVLGEVVAGRSELFVTQLFIRVAAKLDRRAARAAIGEQLAAVRAIKEDGALSDIAQEFADALARGDATDAAASRSAGRLRNLGGGYTKVTTVASTVADIGALQAAKRLSDKSIWRFGVGVAQGDHETLGDGALHVVLLFGHR